MTVMDEVLAPSSCLPPMSGSLRLRPRLGYLAAALGIIALGLLWRSSLLGLSPFLKKYGGDAFWAALIFVLLRFVWPDAHRWRVAFSAFVVSLAVELSQLYHAPWIDSIRDTRLGALALGSTFNAPDIPAYAVGIVIAALLDRAFRTT